MPHPGPDVIKASEDDADLAPKGWSNLFLAFLILKATPEQSEFARSAKSFLLVG